MSMNLLYPLQWTQLAYIIPFLIFIFILLKISNTKKNGHQVPLAPGAWSLVGHLRLLQNRQNNHLILSAMADKQGPIFAIKLGLKRALVVSNWKLAKECLFKNDQTFANRPKTVAIDNMGYNHAMFGFSPAGPYWCEMRTITANEPLSKQGLNTLDWILVSSVATSIKEIHEKSGEMDMKKWLKDITLDVVFQVVAGKKLREVNESEVGTCMDLVGRFFELSVEFIYGDFIPFLRFFDIGGFEKEMKKMGKKLDNMLSRWLEARARTKTRKIS